MQITFINIDKPTPANPIETYPVEFVDAVECQFCGGWADPSELIMIHVLDEGETEYCHETIHEVCGLVAEGKVWSECNCGTS